jgi:hypothetical protein
MKAPPEVAAVIPKKHNSRSETILCHKTIWVRLHESTKIRDKELPMHDVLIKK